MYETLDTGTTVDSAGYLMNIVSLFFSGSEMKQR